MAGFIEALRENREKVQLVVYLILILVFAALLTPMLGEAWQRAGIPRRLFYALNLFGMQTEAVATFIIGLFFGSLLLMTYDTKKRLQGVLLFGGSVIGILLLSARGLLLPNIDFGDTLMWLVFGLLGGALIGGGRELLAARGSQTLELRRASKLVFYMLTIMTVIGFLEYHLVYPVPFDFTGEGQFTIIEPTRSFDVHGGAQQVAFNAVLVCGFVVVTKRFVQYDARRDFLVLGPKASGKSLLLVGAYLEALDRYSGSGDEETATPLNPSQDLMNLVGELDRQQEGWFISATRTQELEALKFQYVYGSVFPMNIQLSGLDYAGEWLEEIPDAMLGTMDRSEMPITLSRVHESVEEADTLILLIDCERYTNNEPLDIEPYFEILQAADDKDIILVASKADVLAERFREEKGLNAEQYYGDFKQFTNDRLSANQTIQSLVAQSAGSEIHPVFYQTRVNDEGERVPMRNSGSVATVGFDKLLERLGEYG
ncbi:hypothetical protein DU504_15570 [Haloplanus salinus]|jgi:hypothetical protein|uniref:Uncharacterized protein n=1 Tax=Haloplanus salinus TaxID=1126245 RepID=A0A368N2B7_9EURY|nr:hypothetical protein [Haloplanus salinus]RCU44213.1 hypothetical protein DU504_15570 [Haloplanus salinus]